MSPMGTASGSNSPTSDSASVQRADAGLNNCEGAAGSTSEKSSCHSAQSISFSAQFFSKWRKSSWVAQTKEEQMFYV